MDVAGPGTARGVEPAEPASTPDTDVPVADPPPEEVVGSASAGPRRLRVVVPVLVLAALFTSAALLAVRARDASARDDARQAALHSARQEAVDLTTIDYRHADQDLARIIAGATGALRTQFESQRQQFPDVLRREKSTSTGTVLAAGITSLHGATAQALVAVDATIGNNASRQAGQSTVVKHYRMVLTLVRQSGHWLVSDVAFAGVPQ